MIYDSQDHLKHTYMGYQQDCDDCKPFLEEIEKGTPGEREAEFKRSKDTGRHMCRGHNDKYPVYDVSGICNVCGGYNYE
jgi:hypothetical protein